MIATIHEQSADFVFETLKVWFSKYGVPEKIFCDNGSPFKARGNNGFEWDE